MGLAVVGRVAPARIDDVHGGCAASPAPRHRGHLGSTLWGACRLQLRRGRAAPGRAALVADRAVARSLSYVRLLLRERRLALAAELRREVPAAPRLSGVVPGRRV